MFAGLISINNDKIPIKTHAIVFSAVEKRVTAGQIKTAMSSCEAISSGEFSFSSLDGFTNKLISSIVMETNNLTARRGWWACKSNYWTDKRKWTAVRKVGRRKMGKRNSRKQKQSSSSSTAEKSKSRLLISNSSKSTNGGSSTVDPKGEFFVFTRIAPPPPRVDQPYGYAF
ncbi:OLC1v1002626C1 [Oldenlandia corymbosa var. corymbosa]|uniref:OLC1v1002626C1 n=1 Tax=Oldenlandia corymbosa var. corymbosa TaxID=529605 RepID=A0AAV1DBH1_OLDCO|nr:OLC1v1002626C1 [Oldenlandia corymbosa var. corymbosa]